MTDSEKPSQRTLEVLSESQVYRDYERAFTQGTGLPLRLQGPTRLNVGRYASEQDNPFSALLSKSDESCAASCAQCYALQCEVEAAAQFQPKTLKCFAGLCETAVPVRVGANVIAFLHTGQVLLQRPDKIQFKRIAATLLKWGADVDLNKLEEHYVRTEDGSVHITPREESYLNMVKATETTLQTRDGPCVFLLKNAVAGLKLRTFTVSLKVFVELNRTPRPILPDGRRGIAANHRPQRFLRRVE